MPSRHLCLRFEAYRDNKRPMADDDQRQHAGMVAGPWAFAVRGVTTTSAVATRSAIAAPDLCARTSPALPNTASRPM